MRLVILFDEDFKFQDTDIVISDSQPERVDAKQFIKVEIDGSKDYVDSLEIFKKNYCDNKIDLILKDVVTSSLNNFHRNCIIPLFAWIETIDRTISNKNFSQILIVGYTKDIEYLPYYEAEGEINKKLLYNSYDAIPQILSKVLNKKGFNHTLVNKKNVFNLRIRVFVRRYVLLLYKFALFISKGIKATFKAKTNLKEAKYNHILFSRAIAHTEFIEKYIKNYDNEALAHIADGVVSKNKNANYVKSNGIKNTLLYKQQIKPTTTLKIFFKVVKLILSLPKKNYIEIEGVKLNFSSAQREMIISYFDVLIYKNTIKNYIPSGIKTLITCEMYTPFAYVIAQIAKEKGIKSMQLQTTAMNIRKEPSFFYSDFFALNTKKSAEKLKKIYPDFTKKIKYIGNITVNDNTRQQSNKINNIKKVIYFSQPIILEQKEENLLLEKLVYLEKKYGFQFFIKLHPRENKSKFNGFNNLKYIEDDLTFGQYINNTDLAVFRTTSLGQQLLINNVPTLTCLLTENSRQFNVDYIDKNYFGTVENIKDIESKIEKYKYLLKDFDRFRAEYLKSNYLDKGLFYFHNQLTRL